MKRRVCDPKVPAVQDSLDRANRTDRVDRGGSRGEQNNEVYIQNDKKQDSQNDEIKDIQSDKTNDNQTVQHENKTIEKEPDSLLIETMKRIERIVQSSKMNQIEP